MERKHYIFVNIFAIFYLLLAIFIFRLYLSYKPYERPVDLISLVLILASLSYLVISIGIFKRKYKTYVSLLFILLAHICWEIITMSPLLFEYPFSVMRFLVKVCGIVFYSFNIYYFVTPKVKQQFK